MTTPSSVSGKHKVAVVGARGYVGAELVKLIIAHPHLELDAIVSRSEAGTPVKGTTLTHQALSPEELAARYANEAASPVVFLAVPNGETGPWVAALCGKQPSNTQAIVIDLSADYRFDDAWTYGLPELKREQIRGKRHIANPGCYATGIQLGLAPFADLLASVPHAFGISGYSGAGSKPSDRNNPEFLRDNVVPYSLTNHIHEREVTRHLTAVRFLPHVAPFFRGIVITLSCTLKEPLTMARAMARCLAHYQDEPLVKVTALGPLPRGSVSDHGVRIGGFAVDGHELAFSVTLDNLLKGAATQALQNANLACNLPEFSGIPLPSEEPTASPPNAQATP
jgi:N-acetyl-gamma-glutamyl-phosphate reductase